MSTFDQALKDRDFKKVWDADAVKREITKMVIRERISHKLTQHQLADKAGLKQPSLARVESGSVTPSIGLLNKLAKALNSKLEVRFKQL